MSRIIELDFTRGVAVFLMILSHLAVFMNIGLRNIEPDKSAEILKVSNQRVKFFHKMGVLAHTIFIILVGVNMVTSYNNSKKKLEKEKIEDEQEFNNKLKKNYTVKNIKRAIFIGLLGLLMSIIIKVVFGKWYVVFGIFQFISVSILLSIPIQLFYDHILAIVLILGLILFKCVNFSKQSKLNLKSIFTGKINSNNKFLDFFPIIPYFIFVVIGIMIGNTNFKVKLSDKRKNNDTVKELSFMGQWSLQFYFLHLIIIFGILKIVLLKKNKGIIQI